MDEILTVSGLINLLDKDRNKRGISGTERLLGISVNGQYFGYVTNAKLDGFGSGLITDVCLELTTERFEQEE